MSYHGKKMFPSDFPRSRLVFGRQNQIVVPPSSMRQPKQRQVK